MKIIQSTVKLINPPEREKALETMTYAGRTCYQSYGENLSDVKKNGKFIKGIIQSGHESVIEHVVVTAEFTVNRAISHQIVRHRLAAYSQESQRYCNYSNDKFNNEITFIEPIWYKEASPQAKLIFKSNCAKAEEDYFQLIEEHDLSPEQARDVLPNACSTTLIATFNLREWRHIFNNRCFGHADPAIKKPMIQALYIMYTRFPDIFYDIIEKLNETNLNYGA